MLFSSNANSVVNVKSPVTTVVDSGVVDHLSNAYPSFATGVGITTLFSANVKPFNKCISNVIQLRLDAIINI